MPISSVCYIKYHTIHLYSIYFYLGQKFFKTYWWGHYFIKKIWDRYLAWSEKGNHPPKSTSLSRFNETYLRFLTTFEWWLIFLHHFIISLQCIDMWISPGTSNKSLWINIVDENNYGFFSQFGRISIRSL